MKKLLIVALTLLTLAALAAGCGKTSAGTPAATVTSTITSTVTATVTTTVPAAPSNAAQLPVYSWEEAIDHIGEMAVVTGPIVNTIGKYDTLTWPKLGMGKVWAQPGWVNIELKVKAGEISPEDYTGKTVAVSGEIYQYNLPGKPPTAAIDVTDPSQLDVLK